MSTNHIQFQPGMSIPEFLASFGSEVQCAERPFGRRAGRMAFGARAAVQRITMSSTTVPASLFQCNICRHQTSLTGPWAA